ncbi:integrase [Mycolicibacterium moriokaense]|nr:integrase [Mycolicibacterium moriokaense]
MRVLGRVRLSRSTEESTSVERQREVIEQWVSANGHTLVGWAEDVDVSGSVDPFETPGLGPWLTERFPDWDAVCAWKLDRLGRNAIQLNKLFGWCQEHDKTVVSCSESIDLGSWAGRMLASVIAGLAEGELEAIRERQRSSRAKLRQLGRWPGGKPPFGYRAVRTEDGWGLEIDPEAHRIVKRIVDSVIVDEKPLSRIAAELTAEGIPTPAAYYAASKAGRSKEGATAPSDARQKGDQSREPGRWHLSPLRNMLRSKALRGFAHHKGETVRDDSGMPVQIAEPLVSLDEWVLLQAALDKTKAAHRPARRAEASPLSGLVYCLGCGAPLHHEANSVKRPQYGKEYEYRYYRCRDRCSVMIPAEDLEQLAGEVFLEQLGDTEVRERVWVPGDSREAELREAVTALDELTQAAGRAKSRTAKQRLQRQLDALDERIAELESAPAREARWEWRGTGETYRSVWETSDSDARRELLARSGITLAAVIEGIEGKRSARNAGAFRFELRVPDGIK